MKRRMNVILYYILQWTWGMIQNVLGLIIFLINVKKKHYFYHGALVTVWNMKGVSAGIGMFIFMSAGCAPDISRSFSEEEVYARTQVHEYGHTVQSVILGPLFLPVIGIPSFVWAGSPAARNYRQKNGISYFSFYPERWANYLGEKITKSKSMEQSVIDD